MKTLGLLLAAYVLALFPRTVAGAQPPGEKPLPPEKTRVIYETLLPPEGQTSAVNRPSHDERPPNTESNEPTGSGMTIARIADILREQEIVLPDLSGRWEFFYDGLQLFLLVDPTHNRLRLMTPLARLDLLRRDADFNEVEFLQKLLKANYLATGDIRFCLNNHVVWAAFLHPLDTLARDDLLSALNQLRLVAHKTRNKQ